MKNILLNIIAIAALALGFTEANAQYNYNNTYNNIRVFRTFRPKIFQRMDIGFHAGFNKAFFDHKTAVVHTQWDESTESNVEVFRSEEGSFRLKNSGYGGNIGFFIPVGYVVPYTRFAINVEAYVTSSTYAIQDFTLFGVEADPMKDITCLSITVPVGFDIKWGAQAILSKHWFGSVGIGGGVAPTYYMVDPASTGPNAEELTVRPYVRAEFGFFTGIFWKIKGTVMFNEVTPGHWVTGDAKSVTLETPYVDQTFRLNKFSYMLGIGFNIGSLKWDRGW